MPPQEVPFPVDPPVLQQRNWRDPEGEERVRMLDALASDISRRQQAKNARTTYESMERFIPPEVRGLIPDMKQTALLGAQTFGPQADVHAMQTSWNNAVRGLLASEQPLSERIKDFGVGSAYTAAAIPMMALPGTITWHGSPHKWPAEPGYPHGRPRLDKMGTGEGAQVKGKGHYAGEAKGTGEQYRRELADRAGEHTLPDNTKVPNWVAYKVQAGKADEVRKQLLEQIAKLERKVAAKEGQWWMDEVGIANQKEILASIDQMEAGATATRGTIYKHDIPDADTAKYLDYDAPLDAQPQVVKDALKKEGFWPDGDTDRIRGGDIFFRMDASGGAEETLRKHGVPGLRFQDQLSRGKAVDYPGTMKAVRIGSKTAEDYGVNYWEELRNLVSQSRHSLEESQGRILKVIRERRKRWDDLSIDPAYQHRDYARDQAEKWLAMEMDAKNKGVAFGDPDITHNYVTWDQDVLNRTKILEIDDVPVYRREHQPTGPESGGARLDDMTGGGEVFPDDIYSSKGLDYYGNRKSKHDRESFNIIQEVRNQPDAEVTIYRAVPKGIDTINPGDFVTLSEDYARLHGSSGYGPAGKDAGVVLSKKVKVRDVFSDGNDLNEFGYFGAKIDNVPANNIHFDEELVNTLSRRRPSALVNQGLVNTLATSIKRQKP